MSSAVRPSPIGSALEPLVALQRVERCVIASLALGWLSMFLPSYLHLAETTWASDEQGHGPIILVVSFWLIYRKIGELQNMPAQPAISVGGTLLVFGLLLYIVGRSQSIGLFDVGAQIPILAGLVLLFKGWRGLRSVWFPLFLLFFMCPLPSDTVAYLTGPLKSAVSAVAANLLHGLGYPVGRAGVLLTVGPYQLLVADACAGLNSIFTLEALGLLYLNLMNHSAIWRNVALVIAILPISFIANVVRVCVLVLITYHFGDEAGQGFLHGFSGMVLFLVALALVLSFDMVIGRYFSSRATVA